MVTQIVLGRVYDYSHVVGRWGGSGAAFMLPIKVAMGTGDVMYVLNRGYELIPTMPWNRTGSSVRVSKVTGGSTPGDEELVGEFTKYGDAEGQIIWPAGIALDSDENFYIPDEWLNRVSVFDKDGNFLRLWGSPGEGDGEFNGPSGIAIDGEDNVFIVDGLNHRVQKLTKEGQFLAKWGSYGSGNGELNSPWGISVDGDGYVYVADSKNNRIQKYSPDGEFVATFGSYGTGRGQLNRPSDVDVDPDGDVYVADWANNRVHVFDPDGKFMTSFLGDAKEVSKWGKMTIAANPDMIKRRREVKTLEPEWRFSMPTGVTFDVERNRLIVADTQRARLQIYKKLTDYIEPQRSI